MPDLIKKNTLFVVVSPTTSLIEDKVFNMNSHLRISSAMMHGDCSYEHRKSVFLEMSKKHIKVSLATAERFALYSFNRFINIFMKN